ncbi:hypothetical protein LPJ76_002021 [Coemansia sp. RSA 638]|nr:hypothetical protein LPJ76_002021 [Coemansia sp. RSA 638]
MHLEMRVWRLLSLGTWFDASTLRSGITLGSLGIQSRGPPSISASHSVVIRTREFDSAASESDGADLAHMPGLWQKATDNSSQPKTDLLRHKDILQCPWNALAMLFFYKWHVLKEPPPDFEDPTWANQPLFHIDPALHDDELEQFCGKIYSEFVDGASRGVQRFKYMSESALDTVTDALTSSKLLRNAVSSAQNMYVTLRSLQNGHCADVQLANAGFRSDNRATTYNVPRQKHTVPQHIEEQIFLFVDTLPSYDDLVDQGGSPEQWDIIVRFCNLLKMLRTVLLQDMAILCDIPFYRRMLLGTAIFSSEVFQSIHFVQSADAIRKHSWNSDFLPLVENTPNDSRLARVVPCTAFASLDKRPTVTDATISQAPIAETLVSVEPVGGSPKTDLGNSKTTCTEPSKSVLSDVVLPSTEVSLAELPAAVLPNVESSKSVLSDADLPDAEPSKSDLPNGILLSTEVFSTELPVAKSLVMTTSTDPIPSSVDALPSVESAVPVSSSVDALTNVDPADSKPSSADSLPSFEPARPDSLSVDPLPIKRKLSSNELDDGAALPHLRLDAESPPIFDAATVKRKLDILQSDDSVPPLKRQHVYNLSNSDETPATPISDIVFVDLTLDSDGNDEDDDEKGCQAQIQHLTRVENNQILDKSSIVLVDHHAEPAVFPIDQTENLVQKQDQKVDESPDTTTVQTPVSSTVSVDETDQTVSKPLESILTAAELLVTAEIGGQSDAPSESADTTDTLQDSSCTSSGSKSDGRVIQDERLTDESDIRKKAALTDKLLQSIRDISSELSEAVTINQFMQRRISRIATCQKYPDPSTVNGKTSTQPPISRERHQRSLVKLDMVAKRNNYHLKSAVNTAARILEEAEAELQIQPK